MQVTPAKYSTLKFTQRQVGIILWEILEKLFQNCGEMERGGGLEMSLGTEVNHLKEMEPMQTDWREWEDERHRWRRDMGAGDREG